MKRARAGSGVFTVEQALHSQGFGSRRECRGLVYAGRVQVLGAVVEHPDDEVACEGLELVVDGRAWPWRAKAVVMLNKPAGHECSLKPRHHPSVMSLLPMPLRLRGIQPVGRLDEDTTGLLLLTDDGELNHRLTSPKWHAPKTYRVGCRHPITAVSLEQLRAPLVLDDDPLPVHALAADLEDDTTVRLTIGEGRYHQVKRMLAAVSNRVDTLHRVTMGPLALDPSLELGQWRWLTPEEESLLRGLRKAGAAEGTPGD